MTEAIHDAIDGPSLSGNEDCVDGKAKDLISGKVQTLMVDYKAAISSLSPSTKLQPAEKHALSHIHEQASRATDIISQFFAESQGSAILGFPKREAGPDSLSETPSKRRR